ncbi:MAG: phosphoribosylaminoimidazolesuccinocarboxamide synthase [Syntrophobacteraceae bacterium]
MVPPVTGLKFFRQGKVRDVYSVDDRHLLIAASDRISAFDQVLSNTPPEVVRRTSQMEEKALKRFTENPAEETL